MGRDFQLKIYYMAEEDNFCWPSTIAKGLVYTLEQTEDGVVWFIRFEKDYELPLTPVLNIF